MDADISHKDKKLSSQYRSETPNEIIEEQTKKIPNLIFLGLGLISFLSSAGVLGARSQKRGLAGLLGMCGSAFLTFGLYNKIVKLEEELLHDRKNSLH